MRQLCEFFPVIVFFAVYYKSDKDLYLSIAAVIVATFISLIAIYFKEEFSNNFKTGFLINVLPIKTIAKSAFMIVGFILKNISFLRKILRPPNTTKITVLTNIIVEIFLSLK